MEEDYLSVAIDVSSKTRDNPERVLFLSVILQALLDATKTKSKVEPSQTSIERERARAWFFCSVGVTCDDFENVYKGEISKSGIPILPSKRARRIPEKLQVLKDYEIPSKEKDAI